MAGAISLAGASAGLALPAAAVFAVARGPDVAVGLYLLLVAVAVFASASHRTIKHLAGVR